MGGSTRGRVAPVQICLRLSEEERPVLRGALLIDLHEQGYLAHTKTPTPLGPPQDPTHRPAVGWGLRFLMGEVLLHLCHWGLADWSRRAPICEVPL